MDPRNIILDTDIGDDVDDLLALAFIERLPEINLLGITTVFRNTLLRAQIARYFLAHHSEIPDTPVHAGLGSPMKAVADTDLIPNQFRQEMSGFSPESTNAIEYLHQTLQTTRATLVCIGPLTNIGTLLRDHPDIRSQIDEIVLMGGCYFTPSKEWNILCDPEAAEIVFSSGVPLRAVGLETTLQCPLTRSQLDAIDERIPRNAFIREACRDWERASSFLPVLHDPLTAYSLLTDSQINFRGEEVAVELTGTLTRGMTYCRPHRLWGREPKHPNVQVSYEVNAERFIEFFLTTTFDEFPTR